MSRPKIAVYIGGPLDGQRHYLRELRPELEYIVAAPAAAPPTMPRSNEFCVRRALYRMVTRPVNPRQLSDRFDCGVIDADIGIYHYLGSNRA